MMAGRPSSASHGIQAQTDIDLHGCPKSNGKTTSEDADGCHGMIPGNRALETVGDHWIQRRKVANYEPLSGVWTSAHEQEGNGHEKSQGESESEGKF